jgi:hypothetical protein
MRSSLGQAQSFEVVNDVSHGGPIDGQPLGDVKVAQWAQKGPRLQTSGINARNLLSSTGTRHTENVALDSAHMAERLRLFLLGEAVLTTGTAISESATDPFTLVAGAAAFAVVAYLWALYFGGSEYIVEHHITQPPTRSGSDSWHKDRTIQISVPGNRGQQPDPFWASRAARLGRGSVRCSAR